MENKESISKSEEIKIESQNEPSSEQKTDDKIFDPNFNPWNIGDTKIDYMKLVHKFGTELIDQELLEKFKKITGRDLHPWLRRGIFFTHRELHKFLDAYENGEPVFLYTGRGPSSDAMHLGHLIPFMFTKWLQDVFDCPLFIQISDEEKAAFKKIDFEILHKMGFENAKEIISCGFKSDKTFIFSNRDYRLNCQSYETFVSEMKMKVPMKTLRDIFGLGDESSVAMIDWPIYQTAAAFYQAYPHVFGNRPAYCLVPYAIDQDPYFRLARDIATKMNLIKPASIMCTFIPPLTGNSGKMSSSVGTDSTLFLTDSEQILKEKIHKHSFSGGGGNGTLEDHRKFGGNPEVDIAYQYLRYFEEEDTVIQEIHDLFKKGDYTCGDLKNKLVQKLSPIFEKIRISRENITKETLDDFYSYKSMTLPKPKEKPKEEMEIKLYGVFENLKIDYRTKYHAPVSTAEQGVDLARSLEGTIGKVLLLKGPKDAYFLYVINSSTVVNIKTLHKRIEVQKISFAQRDTFTQVMKIPHNCPSLFGIINDTEKVIQTIIIEEGISKDKPINFNSMRPDATSTISYQDMIKFIDHHKYPIKFVKE
jgi:tryptophanyl-tRNA synthetase